MKILKLFIYAVLLIVLALTISNILWNFFDPEHKQVLAIMYAIAFIFFGFTLAFAPLFSKKTKDANQE